MPGNNQSLRFRLREVTRDMHCQLEQHITFGTPNDISQDHYIRFLKRMYGIHIPIERALERLDWTPLRIDLANRCRSRLIEVDLCELGLNKFAIPQLPVVSQTPVLETVFNGLGALYVLEGSTLGGQVLLRQLSCTLGISPDHGGRFLSGYNENTGTMWRQFTDTINAYSVDSPEGKDIESGALETFRIFLNWFAATT